MHNSLQCICKAKNITKSAVKAWLLKIITCEPDKAIGTHTTGHFQIQFPLFFKAIKTH